MVKRCGLFGWVREWVGLYFRRQSDRRRLSATRGSVAVASRCDPIAGRLLNALKFDLALGVGSGVGASVQCWILPPALVAAVAAARRKGAACGAVFGGLGYLGFVVLFWQVQPADVGN